MSCSVNQIIKQASDWIGYRESNGTHKEIIDIYNSHLPRARGYKLKYTDSWCAGTVSAAAIACGATDIIPTEVSCPKMVDLFKKKGIWVENENRTPNVGDIVFYDWDDSGKGDNTGSPDHVGICNSVNKSKKTFTVIEGNYSNAVKVRTLEFNGKYLRGFGVPNYSEDTKKDISEVAKEVIAGKWGNGAERKEKLTKAGYKFSEVQKLVTTMLQTTTKKSNSEVAKEVIQGKWGNGKARKDRLTAAGYNYSEIQKLVNKMLP